MVVLRACCPPCGATMPQSVPNCPFCGDPMTLTTMNERDLEDDDDITLIHCLDSDTDNVRVHDNDTEHDTLSYDTDRDTEVDTDIDTDDSLSSFSRAQENWDRSGNDVVDFAFGWGWNGWRWSYKKIMKALSYRNLHPRTSQKTSTASKTLPRESKTLPRR